MGGVVDLIGINNGAPRHLFDATLNAFITAICLCAALSSALAPAHAEDKAIGAGKAVLFRRADTHCGPKLNAPLQRSDTLAALTFALSRFLLAASS
jgi:hypothetical protein